MDVEEKDVTIDLESLNLRKKKTNKHKDKKHKRKKRKHKVSDSEVENPNKKSKSKNKKRKRSKERKNLKKLKISSVEENIPGPSVPEKLLVDQSKSRAPMTKEEWEKSQSVIRRVYDETGRSRLT